MVVIPTATALPTAEGAVQVAMEELPFTLHSARVLILGFGRVGKLTAHRMGALGAKVTVCAQGYADLAWAAAYGHETMWLEKLGGELVAFLHYPPVYDSMECQELLDLLAENQVSRCYFGHIHGQYAAQKALVGEYKGVHMRLISADYVQFGWNRTLNFSLFPEVFAGKL